MISRICIAIALAGCAVLLVGAAATPRENEDVETGFLFKTINAGDRDYDYIVYVPRAYAASPGGLEAEGGSGGWPCILFLHGMGESGTDGQRQMLIGLAPRVIDKAERWPFIIIMPQKPVATDQWEAHLPAVRALLDRTLSEYRIDDSRLYLTGLSQGGHGTWAFNALMPGRFAAIAPVCGYAEAPVEGYVANRTWKADPESEQTSQIIAAAADTPIWAFHGEADPVVPASQTMFLVEQLRSAGGDARATLYPEVGHDAWGPAYAEDLPQWFLSHRRED